MSARMFRCRECGYPFKTAAEGWDRHADLMCPACGSDDVTIVVELARADAVPTPMVWMSVRAAGWRAKPEDSYPPPPRD